MKKLVFIASLRHSGSTLLDLVLGGHPRFVGLGEVSQVIIRPGGVQKTEKRGSVCSCGQQINECVFWHEVADSLRDWDNPNVAERYQAMLEIFEKTFGAEAIPVDSSKYLDNLDALQSLDVEVSVLHIMKDVRSFTISQIDNFRRKATSEQAFDFKHAPLYLFWRWYLQNKKMQRFFTERKLNVLQLGYEELCLSSKPMLERICEFLDVDVEPSMLTLTASQSHIMRGNRMRTQKDKAVISYDHRWFFRNEWILPAFLFRNIMNFNAREVYHNHTGAKWGQ